MQWIIALILVIGAAAIYRYWDTILVGAIAGTLARMVFAWQTATASSVVWTFIISVIGGLLLGMVFISVIGFFWPDKLDQMMNKKA